MVDADMSKVFSDSNLIEKILPLLKKSWAGYYFAKYIHLLLAVLETLPFYSMV